MITRVATFGVYVRGQDRAVDFYVNKLGFEQRRDEPKSSEAGRVRAAAAAPTGDRVVIVRRHGERVGDRSHRGKAAR